MENVLRCNLCCSPCRADSLHELHELIQSNSILDIAMWINNALREGDTSAIQPSKNPALFIAEVVVKLGITCLAVARQLRQWVTCKANSLHKMGTVRQMSFMRTKRLPASD